MPLFRLLRHRLEADAFDLGIHVGVGAAPGRLSRRRGRVVDDAHEHGDAGLAAEGDETRERLATEPRSKVTFDIEPLGDDQVKLTVVHDGLEPGGLTGSLISDGWPRVLANLKTFLETGEPLPDRSASGRLAELGVTRS